VVGVCVVFECGRGVFEWVDFAEEGAGGVDLFCSMVMEISGRQDMGRRYGRVRQGRCCELGMEYCMDFGVWGLGHRGA
jgi:hypothetical protein